MSEAKGSCFGFSVRSELDLRFLRHGTDVDSIEISLHDGVEPDGTRTVIEWRETTERPYAARLCEADGRYHLWISRSGWFAVDPAAPSIAVPRDDEPVRREVRLWGIPALLCFLGRGDLPLHAAAVEVDGGAVLLAAPGTFGKSTLAAAFHDAGFRVLSEDTTCIRRAEPSIVPGPAVLRLRPDVAGYFRLEGASIVGEDEDRLHVSVDEARRGGSEAVPLRATYILRAGDHVELRRVAAHEALKDVWALSFRLPTEQDVARSFAAVADLVAASPVWSLTRPLRLDELPSTVEQIATSA